MSPKTANPFKPAAQAKPLVKAMIFGAEGIGKTHLGLSAPGKIAVVDAEGGTSFFAGRPGISEFDVLPAKSYLEIKSAIEFLGRSPGEYETFMIDPVTVVYEVLQEAARQRRAQKRNVAVEDADLEWMDWGRIRALYKQLMNAITGLPMHVMLIAREKDDVIRRGGETEKVGVKADAATGSGYYVDMKIRLATDSGSRIAIVEKDRLGIHGLNARIPDPTWANVFGPALKLKGKAERVVVDDAEAAASDAAGAITDHTTPALAEAAFSALSLLGRDPQEFLKGKGLASFMDAPPESLRRLIDAANQVPDTAPTE
jgi:hypothetical protein